MPLDDFRSIHLPYCLLRQKDGTYVILNREYKPIGFRTRDWIQYSDFPICISLEGVTPELAKRLSYCGDANVERIFLYSDGTIPDPGTPHSQAYFSRLELLASLHCASPL